jgi:hemerythrin-like domain-containing protein
MPDYGHDMFFGVSLPPSARDHEALLGTAELADDLGLDVVGIQDHPYQATFLDAWTLLSYVAGRTQRIRLLPDVANIPLRPPAVLARSAAALDILSNGRVELGLGAGYFLEPIAAMGGPRRTMGENVDALDEAITVIRSLWKVGPAVHFQGKHYSLSGARPGPAPAHPIGIWLGAYKPRMLKLTGRSADGWIPSLGYTTPEELGRLNEMIDVAAEAAGRKPSAIRRAFNVSGAFANVDSGFLQGPPRVWSEQLTELTLRDGISTYILSLSPGADAEMRRWAEEVVPAVRESVAKERRERPDPFAVPQVTEASSRAAREAEKLVAEEEKKFAIGSSGAQMLLAVHEHLRQELAKLREVIQEVREGRSSAAEARSYLNAMTMRQNYWTLGAFCAAYCRVVSIHHAIEDAQLFPDLKAADQSLTPILDRLRHEHEGIAKVLSDIDTALVATVEDEERLDDTEEAVDHLSDALLAHLKYEEEQLVEPIERLGIKV